MLKSPITVVDLPICPLNFAVTCIIQDLYVLCELLFLTSAVTLFISLDIEFALKSIFSDVSIATLAFHWLGFD